MKIEKLTENKIRVIIHSEELGLNTKNIITTLENWKRENKITISDFKKEKKENEEEF